VGHGSRLQAVTQSRRSLIVLLVLAGVAAVSAGGATARQELIVPNVGIRGVKLGMSLAQVKRMLGSGAILNKRQKLGARSQYVEYVWDYGSFRVGFVRRSARTRVALIATTLSSQRTRSGVGVGTRLKRAQERTGARCFDVDYFAREQWYRDPSTESTRYCLVGSPRGKRTVFIIGQPYHRSGPTPSKLPYIVREVIVRGAF
jgi:hypothetical protein